MAFASDDARKGLIGILKAFDRAGIPHFLTGALVRNLMGSARTSEDFDIVVDMRGRTNEDVRRVLEDAGYTVSGPVTGDLGTRWVTEAGGVETDIWLPADNETHRREMANRITVEWHGHSVPLMAPEDFVLMKVLLWARKRRKSTDLDDAYQVLMIAWDTIDRDRLLDRAAFHRISKPMGELLELAREDRGKRR